MRSSITLSFGVHTLFAMVCALLISQQATIAPPRKLTWVELTREATLRAPDKYQKQIVQTTPGREVEKPAEDAFLSERNQVVDRQTVNKEKQIATAARADKAQPRAPSAGNLTGPGDRAKAAPLAKLGLPVLSHLRELSRRSVAQPDAPQWAASGLEARDYIQGMNEGEKTALNTREYVFYGYYQRIRERLDRAWVPILREKLIRYYRAGRQLASDMDHTTRLMVILNGNGEIVRVQVLSESGTHDLDEAAIRAFNRAGPFPNPPKGIIDPMGQIQIPWEFILRT